MSNTHAITAQYLLQAHKGFKAEVGNFSFYELASEIAEKYPLQASVIILATWNSGRFRFISSDQPFLNQLDNALKGCSEHFTKLKDENLMTIDLEKSDHKDTVIKIYKILSEIKGVKFTGASKVMSLMNNALFVMWDDYIRGSKYVKGIKSKKMYNELQIAKEGLWQHKKYKTTGEDYLQFLKDIQVRFKGLQWSNQELSLAKAIDEFNYINITIPIKAIEKISKSSKNPSSP